MTATPHEIDKKDLVRPAGEYGARRVTMEDGRLIYQRDGNPKYELTPCRTRCFGSTGWRRF